MLDMGPDLVIGFTDDIVKSTGTMDMILRAGRANAPILFMNSVGTLWMRPLWEPLSRR